MSIGIKSRVSQHIVRLTRVSFMRPVLLLLYYIWYYEKLGDSLSSLRSDWNRIQQFHRVSYLKKLFIKSSQRMIKFNTFTKAAIIERRRDGNNKALCVVKSLNDFAWECLKGKCFKIYLEELKVMENWKIIVTIFFVVWLKTLI